MHWLRIDGRFTVRAVHQLAVDRTSEDQLDGLLLIWKLCVQQRVKVFLWMLAKGSILTNFQWWRMWLASNLVYWRCQGEWENSLHVVRDCLRSRELWESRQSTDMLSGFFSFDLREWLLKNLHAKGRGRWRWGAGPERPQIVTIAWWNLWKWRNQEVFRGEIVPLQQQVAELHHTIAESVATWKDSIDFVDFVGGPLWAELACCTN